jgi:large subunit ribosomal protein L29
LKSSEIRNMTEAEIETNLISLKEKMFNLRAESATGRIERPQHIGQAKKDIARLYTILKEKQSGN